MRVLVIGGGPGGAAAAIELARGGADVRIVEKSRWPRAKTCGDGISPPGVREAKSLGLALDDRWPLGQGEIATPSGVRFRSGWRSETPWGTIVERAVFDARLMALAVAAGARFEPETTARELVANGAKPSVRLGKNGAAAEGATGALAGKAGFGKHRTRLVAIRGYAESIRPLDAVFGLYFERGLSPGYGWIFPLSDQRANVGILVGPRIVQRAGGDLRGLLTAWLRSSPVVRERLGAGADLGELSGGIIPTGRPRRVRRGVFLVGDAAGVADPFSAEGIFQAMATGRAAAQALLAGGPGRRAETAYRKALRPFDRNAAEAYRLRLGFDFVIDALGRRALTRPKLAHHLSSSGFFMKESLAAFLWGIARTW
jgi:geranylgeranyl reductase family protein